VTWPEVVDDAIKIGLPALTAWLIARGSRLHEFEKERRRRKQDCLEQIIENLAEQESAHDAFCVSSLAYGLATKEEKPDVAKVFLTNVNQNREQSDLAQTKLNRSRSKLIVFDFNECAASLQTYNRALGEFKTVLMEFRHGKKETEVYQSDRRKLRESADKLRQAVAKAFATL
jgi:hypothetical protein